MGNYGSWLNGLQKAKNDFDESKAKLLDISMAIKGENVSREIVKNPRTGEPSYHILTKAGEEQYISNSDILNAYVDCTSKLKVYKAERNKVLRDLNETEVKILKTTEENLAEMKKLLGLK